MAKTYVQSDVIRPMEYTEFRGKLYIAVRRDGLFSCSEQCHANGNGSKFCTGFCTRWKNGDSVVFKRVAEPTTDYVVVETEYAKTCRLGEPEKHKTK